MHFDSSGKLCRYGFPDRRVGDRDLPPIRARHPELGAWLAEWPPDDYAVIYPGIADQPPVHEQQSVDRLLGAGRARILRDLDHAATTSDLAAQFGAALGTIGEHLAVPRNTRLIAGTRIGHRVLDRRPGLGDQALARPDS